MANRGFYSQLDQKQINQAITKLAFYEIEKRDNIKKIVKSTSKDIQETARQLVPKDEGHTEMSIEPKYFEDGLSATIGPRKPDGWKAHLLEFGSYNVMAKRELPARPFLNPAAERHRQEYLQKVKNELGET